MYDAKTLPLTSLVGRKIINVYVNENKDAMLLITDEGNFYLNWDGDCCARCYIAHVSGSEYLIGSTILEAENTQWSDLENTDDSVLQSMGTKFKTTKGYVDIETRVSHNGYYGGMVNISKEGYVDQYNNYVVVFDNDLSPLEDF